MAELKPCPFCGCKAHLYEGQRGMYVMCEDCLSKSFEFPMASGTFAKSVLIVHWNGELKKEKTE